VQLIWLPFCQFYVIYGPQMEPTDIW